MPVSGQAQVVPPTATQIKADNSLSNNTKVTQGGTTFTITEGSRSGSNLFHSFDLFTIKQGDTALFSNIFKGETGPVTSNILGRVTGGQRSDVFGTIKTDVNFGTANLFLINPAGWIFGSTASLNVGGAFRVATADYVRLNDEARFNAKPGAADQLLTTAPVAAFGFTNSNPAGITIQGSRLQVGTGQTLSVVGGNIQIAGGTLLPTLGAAAGRVEVASVTSTGEVKLRTSAGAPDFSLDSVTNLGQINLSNAAQLSVTGTSSAGGGTVVIRGGQLIAVQSSKILATTSSAANGAPTAVDIDVTGGVTLAGGSQIQVQTTAAGTAGSVTLAANSLQMQDSSSLIQSSTTNRGVGGAISVDVGTLALSGGASIQTVSDFNPLFRLSGGPAGKLTVNATNSISIDGANSGLSSTTKGTGAGGEVTIAAPSASLTLDHGASVLTVSSGTPPSVAAPGSGGDLVVDVASLSLTNGAKLQSQTVSAPGGKVTVTGTGLAAISGSGSGIFSGSSGTGSVGAIKLDASQVSLTAAGAIQSGTSQTPAGGNVDVKATDSIVILGGGGISSQARTQAVGNVAVSAGTSLLMDNGFISTSTGGTGRAGNISVNAQAVSLTGGGQITSSSQLVASGAGGDITMTVADSVSISGQFVGNRLSPPFVTDPNSGLFSTASGSGPGGRIQVTAPTLTLGNGGKISVATTSSLPSGSAGNVDLNVNNLTLTSNARIDSGTTGAGHGGNMTINATGGQVAISGGAGLFSNAGGSGAGGDINLSAQQVNLGGGGVISAKSTGTANAIAGNVNVKFGDTFNINGGTITTQSTVADGGNISITSTGSLFHLVDGQITTSVQSGTGGGGNITIGSETHPLEFVVLDGSQVRADAFGGPGGNINIAAGVFLTQGSVVSASSALNTPGAINVQARVTDLSRNVARLPENVLQAALLLRASCTARLASGKSSSLVLAGREGVPPEPDSLLWSPLLPDDSIAMTPSTIEDLQAELLPRFLRASLDPKCAR